MIMKIFVNFVDTSQADYSQAKRTRFDFPEPDRLGLPAPQTVSDIGRLPGLNELRLKAERYSTIKGPQAHAAL